MATHPVDGAMNDSASVPRPVLFIHGLFPYIGLLLQGIGETRASIAGLLIGCFAVGGICYSIFVPYLVKAVPQRHLMFAGGVIAAVVLATLHYERCARPQPNTPNRPPTPI